MRVNPGELRTFLRTYARIAGFAWRAAPGVAALLLLAHLALAAVPPAQAWVYKLLVDGVAGAGSASFDPSRVWTAGALYAITLLLAQAAAAVMHPLDSQMTEQLQGQMSLRLLEIGERQAGLAFYDDEAVQNDLRTARGSLDYVLMEAVSMVPQTVQQGIVVVTLMLLLARLHLVLPLLLIATALLHLRYESRLQYNLWSGFAARSPHFRWLNYLQDVLMSAEFAKEVRLFGLGGFFLGLYRQTFARAHEELVRLRRGEQWSTTRYGLLNAAVTGGAYVVIVLAASRHRLTLGDVALYTSATFQLSSALQILIQYYGALVRERLQVQCFHDLLDRAPVLEATEPSWDSPHPLAPSPNSGRGGTSGMRIFPPPSPRIGRGGQGGEGYYQGGGSSPHAPLIEVRDVWFSYPKGAVPALRGVDLRITPGEKVAIVGENGAGKTTLVSLIARLYDPTQGEVLVDGLPLRALDVRQWRGRIAAVSQEFLRLEAPLRVNLALGELSRVADDGALWDACQRVGVAEAARTLPHGLDQMLGRRFEGGVELSGGEWQKIALARALLRVEAGLILLDEPTSALDAPTEHALFRRFVDLAAERTAILISHRFSTVSMADRIVVLERGAILEEGTHTALIARGGRYAELFELQAARYR